jgi:hypothetical protein
MIDLNGYKTQEEVKYQLIPADSIVNVEMKIVPSEGSWITESKFGNSKYLNCMFEVLDGEYANRKIFDAFGIEGEERFVSLGQARIRAAVEAARGIAHNDDSEEAKQKRKIDDFNELNGLRFTAKVGVRKDKEGKYADKNNIKEIIVKKIDNNIEILF